MIIKKIFIFLIACVVVIVFVLFLNIKKENKMVVLDVGQGDAVLFQSASGSHLLVDCGPDVSVVFGLSAHLNFQDDIDVLIVTHPDSDHATGCVEVIRQYNVRHVIALATEDDLPAYTVFIKEALKQNIPITRPIAGDVIVLPGMRIDVLWPLSHEDAYSLSSNDASYVTRVTVGDSAVLLTGDVSKEIEERLVFLYRDKLRSDYFKLGHHGSDTSSGDLLLSEVSPQEVFNSSGKGNRFGHPHQEVQERLRVLGMPLRDTQDHGSIEVGL
ncbi:MAG: ComEC/Rec2 family competence protein [Patescibacteria group bacterium]